MNCPLCNSQKLAEVSYESCQVYVCGNCGLQFLEETSNDMSYYEGYYQRFRGQGQPDDELRLIQYEIDARHLSTYIDQGTILDVGCSNGGFIQALDRSGDYVLHGIDPDNQAIAQARGRFSDSRIRFDGVDLLSFKPQNQYDAVVFRGTFQYLGTTLTDAMGKILALLKDDGKIIIYSLPNSDSFLYYLSQDKWHLFHAIEHRLIFNEQSVKYLCHAFHLELLELSYPYLNTAYANVDDDYAAVVKVAQGGVPKSIPFWGSIMQAVIQHEG